LGGIYLVLYSSFFAYMPGAFDGLYAGLAYWLGSQQEYARGDQPWYYYLMQLPLYEPLAVIAAFGTVAAMMTGVVRRVLEERRRADDNRLATDNERTSDERAQALAGAAAPHTEGDSPAAESPTSDTMAKPAGMVPWALFPLLV